MGRLEALAESVIKGDIDAAVTQTQGALDDGLDVQRIISDSLITSMDVVGERFSKGQIFVPQMLRAAKTMQQCMKLLEPFLKEGDVVPKGKVLIGTVRGDLHDIGKNLVAMMLDGAGFTVTDLGVDVSPETFVQKTQEVQPDILGMSALLSTTMPAMRQTIEALQKADLRDTCKVMIGGAPVTAKYAQEIGADSYAPDAGSAVGEAKKLLGIS
jgi:5-methyltetrahydrofolate--homocysteine methyltransferase